MFGRFSRPPSLPARLIASRGTSLVEALVATVIVATITAGVAHLLLWARRATWSAGMLSIAVTLATQKLEALEALTWEVDAAGTAISDDNTDLSREPPGSSGSGLRPSPAGTLATNTSGFFDYVDVNGQWRAAAGGPLPGAAFVRRWSIAPFAADPSNTIVLTVVVLPLVDAAAAEGRPARGARLTSIRTRVLR